MYMNFGTIRLYAFPLIKILRFSELGLFSLIDVFSADTLPTYRPISMFRMNMPLPSSGMGESNPSWQYKVSQQEVYDILPLNLQLLLLSINVDIRATENIPNHHFSVQVSILDKYIIYLQSPLQCVNKTAASYIHNYHFSIYSQLPFLCMSL
jgi:hypothetical protein